MSKESPMVLDIRLILQQGQEPFSEIMRAVGLLGAGEELLLIAPFEPLPLLGVLGQQGYECESRSDGQSDDWRIRIRRPAGAGEGRELDVRSLDTLPAVERALSECSLLGRGETLAVLTAGLPSELLEILPERGFEGDPEQTASGHWLTRIWRITRK